MILLLIKLISLSSISYKSTVDKYVLFPPSSQAKGVESLLSPTTSNFNTAICLSLPVKEFEPPPETCTNILSSVPGVPGENGKSGFTLLTEKLPCTSEPSTASLKIITLEL